MHELSIALNLVDLACGEAATLDGERIDVLHVDVGVRSGVVREALAFSFQAAAMGTPVEGARLEIRSVAATIWCDACSATRELKGVLDCRCPICEVPALTLLTGAELQLVSLEVCR